MLRDTDLQQRKISRENVEILGRISDLVRSRGSRLALILIPLRGMMAPEDVRKRAARFIDFRDHAVQLEEYQTAVRELSSRGLLVPDLEAVYRGADDAVLKQDTHWSSKGAFLAAEKLAVLLERIGSLPGSGRTKLYERDLVERHIVEGNLKKIIQPACDRSIADDVMLVEHIKPTEQDQQKALLGDPEAGDPAVLLLGTSHAAYRGENYFYFAEALSFHLQAHVTNLAISGGGLAGAFELLNAQEELAENIELYVWEAAYYNLDSKSDDLRQVAALLAAPCSSSANGNNAFELKPSQWSPWLDVADSVEQVEITVPEFVAGTVWIETRDARDRIRKFRIRKRSKIPARFASDIWKIYAGPAKKGESRAQSVAMRFRSDGLDSAVSASFKTCNLVPK